MNSVRSPKRRKVSDNTSKDAACCPAVSKSPKTAITFLVDCSNLENATTGAVNAAKIAAPAKPTSLPNELISEPRCSRACPLNCGPLCCLLKEALSAASNCSWEINPFLRAAFNAFCSSTLCSANLLLRSARFNPCLANLFSASIALFRFP